VTLTAMLSQARASLARQDAASTMRLCQSVLKTEPANPPALAMLAEAARLADDFETAVIALRKLTEVAPGQPGIFLSLGRALIQLQRNAEAIEALEKCLALDKNNIEALRSIGNAFAREGDKERAVDAMRKTIALNERDTAAHYQLTTLVRAAADDPRTEQLKALYASDGFSDRERSRLAFSIARILDQQEKFDDAFAWFTTANELRLKDSDFGGEADAVWTQRAIDTFTPELFRQRGASDSAGKQAVLIVGMPRSGSTLLEQVLAWHPDVHGAGELMLLPDTLGGLGEWLGADDVLPQAAATVPAEAWQQLGRRYLKALTKLAPSAERVVDKQLFNYTLVGFAMLMLPGTRIIHTSRDPMATCWSCYATAFRNNRGFTCNLAELGKTWLLYRRLMDHWHATLPDSLMEVRYEDMLDDLEGTSRKVLNFIGLPWDDKCLEFYNTRRTVMTASKTQVRQPIYKDAREHWRNYESHLEPLRLAMQADS